jgi:hypothetical protein
MREPVKTTVTKRCNAFIPSANAAAYLPSAALAAVERYKRKHGGLWVGGTVDSTDVDIVFRPNAVNVAFHENLTNLVIPLSAIDRVSWEFGVLTGIVVVEYGDAAFRFRCFGAKAVVRRLQSLLSRS